MDDPPFGKKTASLFDALDHGAVPARWLYETASQQKAWARLHGQSSPIHQDKGRRLYRRFFQSIQLPAAKELTLISLGAGTGSKDAELAQLLSSKVDRLHYLPWDSTHAMARRAAQAVAHHTPLFSKLQCHPGAIDFHHAHTWKLPRFGGGKRLILFFGMLPVLSYRESWKLLHKMVRPGDHLFLSANLFNPQLTSTTLEHLLPQYDNPLTRAWLLEFWKTLGIDLRVGRLHFQIGHDPDQPSIPRFEAWFVFKRAVVLRLKKRRIKFRPQQRILTFFSNRHTTQGVADFMRDLKIIPRLQRTSNVHQELLLEGYCQKR